jgi:2,4-dienoyl-CoA reductase-like NADH-dependent reductase (Old Yellow Enzyme family)
MPTLSEPLTFGRHRVRNRLVMAPMVTGFAEDHRASDRQVAWYRDHARSGVGLVIVESTAVLPDGIIMPRLLGAWEDAQIPGLARIASAIRAEGALAAVQIVHGGARAWSPDPRPDRMAPSPVALVPGPEPREMTEAGILGVVQAFADAAARAVKAGFDGVEIHCAHYYLLSQFLSPFSNRRQDRWGGSRENRFRLALEVARAVRKVIGPDRILLARMHAVEFMDGGLSAEDAVLLARELEGAGVDVIDASAVGQASLGVWEGIPYCSTSSVPPKGSPGGTYAPHAGKLREALEVPLIAVGKLAEPGCAQAALDAGHADLVALGRPLIADPLAAEKLLAGRGAEIIPCRECLSCFRGIREGAVRCSVNKALQ